MTKADDVEEIVRKIKDITDYMAELRQERSKLMLQLQEYMTIADIAYMTGFHRNTVGVMIGEAK